MLFMQFMQILALCTITIFAPIALIVLWIILDSRGYFDDMM